MLWDKNQESTSILSPKKENEFDLAVVRWVKLEWSQKEKNKCHLLVHGI